MVKLILLLGVLIIQVTVRAAPSDIRQTIEESNTNNTEENIEKAPEAITEQHLEQNNDNEDEYNPVQGQRQKRWYNYYGYGMPPINPIVYPSNLRDEPTKGTNGFEDPFTQIYRRLREIASVARQPPPPPYLPSHLPIFFPIIYIPCRCGSGPTNTNTTPPPSNNNATNSDFEISNRFPVMDDVRQNWGFVINTSEPIDADDYVRPISFDPIPPKRPPIRPQPSVEHGTNQEEAPSLGSVANNGMSTTTMTNRPSQTQRPQSFIPSTTTAPEVPSACDGAILSCCHQPEVTYDCFQLQGCPYPPSSGNPCEINIILRVIERFQRYYGQKTG